MIYSICHGLVEERDFVQMPCSCQEHRSCALGFFGDATPRARINGVRTGTYQVTCLNPALHDVHQKVDLHFLLQQIQGLGGSADTAEERAIDARVVAATLHLNRRSTTATETIPLSRSADERGEESIVRLAWHCPLTITSGPGHAGLVSSKLQTVTDLSSKVGSPTRIAPWKTYRGPPTGEMAGSG